MATITAQNTKDGTIYKSSTLSFTAARDSALGTVRDTWQGVSVSVKAAKTSTRGGGNSWQVYRYFMEFDTSDIKIKPLSAKLKIYGFSSGNTADFYVVKSTQSSPLAAGDFNNIDGWQIRTDNTSNVTKYSDEVTSWSTSAWNEITLNANAISDMTNNSTLKFCLIEADHDLAYANYSSNFSKSIGTYQADWGTSTERPYLDYETEKFIEKKRKRKRLQLQYTAKSGSKDTAGTAQYIAKTHRGNRYNLLTDKNGRQLKQNDVVKLNAGFLDMAGGNWQTYPSASTGRSMGDGEVVFVNSQNNWSFKIDLDKLPSMMTASFIEYVEDGPS